MILWVFVVRDRAKCVCVPPCVFVWIASQSERPIRIKYRIACVHLQKEISFGVSNGVVKKKHADCNLRPILKDLDTYKFRKPEVWKLQPLFLSNRIFFHSSYKMLNCCCYSFPLLYWYPYYISRDHSELNKFVCVCVFSSSLCFYYYYCCCHSYTCSAVFR